MIDVSGFSDKDSKRPEYRELYESYSFIEAYAKHTDLRIAKDGPELAIGARRDGSQDWGIHGKQQLDFLISRGLKPEHSLLDIGCGTGRLACKAADYCQYTGLDISQSAIEHCKATVNAEFIHGDGTLKPVKDRAFNLIWAHSVMTHLPADAIEALIQDLSEMAFGEFCFTFKEAGQVHRSGLKQFQYPVSFFVKLAERYGLKAERLPHEWPAGQKTMRVWRG